MKRVFSILLAAVMMFTLLATGAFAGTEGYTIDKNDTGSGCVGTVEYDADKSVYTASYTGDDIVAGREYLLLVVKGTDFAGYSVSDTTIKYIDQKSKDADETTVSFEFIPSSVPDCLVILSGTFGPEGTTNRTPKLLGKLTAQGVQVTGTVTSYGTGAATVSLYDSTGAQVGQSVQTENGAYTFESVPTGATYYVKAAKAGHVGSPVTVAVTEDAESATAPAITLYGGNVNESAPSTQINVDDLSFLLGDFGKAIAYNDVFVYPLADINDNGQVNVDDLSFLLTGFGKSDESVASFIGS